MEEELVILIVSIIALISSGFILFTLAITLMDHKIRSRPSTAPIASFLVASFIQGALALPMYVYRKISSHRNVSRDGICDLYRVPYFFCGHILTMSLLYVSLDRLFVITRPFLYKDYVTTRRFTLLLFASWLVTMAIDSIPFMVASSFEGDCVYIPNKDWGIIVIIVYIIIPLITIVVCYTFIWMKAVKIAREVDRLRVYTPHHQQQQQQQQQTCFDDIEIHNNTTNSDVTGCGDKGSPSNTDNKNNSNPRQKPHHKQHRRHLGVSIVELKATKTSIILIATYIICWGPLGIFYMIDHFCNNCYSDKGQLSVFRTTVKILALTSSLIAPAVYCWWNKEFRKATVRMVKRFRNETVSF